MNIGDCMNINSVNPLYLNITHSNGYIEKNGVNKHLVFDSTDENKELLKKYDDVFNGIRDKIKEISSNDCDYKKDYLKIKFNSDDHLPLNKSLKFTLMTVNIRCVFEENGKLYPQVFLADILYELTNKKMIEYKRTDISEGTDFNKTNKSKQCMLCHYWYSLDNNFSYGPYLCDGCYNIMQKSNNFKNIAIVHVKKSVYRIYFLYMSKRKSKILMANSNLIDKKGALYIVIYINE